MSDIPEITFTQSAVSDVRQLPGLLQGRDDLHARLEGLIDPFGLVLSLSISALAFDPMPGSGYFIVALALVMLTAPGRSRLHVPWPRLANDVVVLSTTLIALLIFLGWATRTLNAFAEAAIVNWFWIAPACLLSAHAAFRGAAPFVLRRTQRCVVVGMNEQGIALASRIAQNPYTNLSFEGFFDDRVVPRGTPAVDHRVLGRFDNVAAYVKSHHIHVIYLSLPMASQERVLKLLDRLRDTTASIYFVPDQFVTDLIQGRTGRVIDIPVVAVCETPFVGLHGLVKRGADVVLSSLALALLAPVLGTIAALVKLGSPGPVIFKQRRYGLNGEEFHVYKFRSMRVTEDGAVIRQAQRDDDRITPLGSFLRRTSLDELPQLLNVLQGRMSLVGPRPHAIAHNETYRKLIKGYMVRHKVRPGITGWAQVNGLRGETETVEKMAARIRYDLDYLRNWSLGLDLYILFRTVALVIRDRNAY